MTGPTKDVNLDHVFDQMGEQTAAYSSELEAMAGKLDPGNPADLIKFQHKMNKYTVQMELQSTFIKVLRDVCRSIVQKTG